MTTDEPPMQVLLIDDERLFLRSMQRAFARHPKIALETCDDCREALGRIAGGRRYDAILCDLQLPVLSGLDLFRLLESFEPDQARRMVFISGGELGDEADGLVAGHHLASLPKPFDTGALELLLEQMRQRQHPESAAIEQR